MNRYLAAEELIRALDEARELAQAGKINRRDAERVGRTYEEYRKASRAVVR